MQVFVKFLLNSLTFLIPLKVMYDEYSAEQIFEKDQIHFHTKNGSEAYMKMVMKGLQSFAEVREKLLAVQE